MVVPQNQPRDRLHVSLSRELRRRGWMLIHWQDADSSGAKAVSEIFPSAEIMLCGGYAGRPHKKYWKNIRKYKLRLKNTRMSFLMCVAKILSIVNV